MSIKHRLRKYRSTGRKQKSHYKRKTNRPYRKSFRSILRALLRGDK